MRRKHYPLKSGFVERPPCGVETHSVNDSIGVEKCPLPLTQPGQKQSTSAFP
ncbi:hypothetical protein R20943_05972 [Paraburkholderia aspalathi]|nr:hypothetical protein R20943_05972 [Paraburkholderia aspalathi]